MKRHLLITTLAGLFLTHSALAELPQCNAVVQAANQQLESMNQKYVRDENKLTALLRALNRDDILPPEYVTREQAMRMGWSGKPEDSLWSIWALNKKVLGGNPWNGKPLPGSERWYSADIDSIRGLPSSKQLIYSPQSEMRYLTSDNGNSIVELPPCQ